METKDKAGSWGFYQGPLGRKRWYVNLDTFEPPFIHRLAAWFLGLKYVRLDKQND